MGGGRITAQERLFWPRVFAGHPGVSGSWGLPPEPGVVRQVLSWAPSGPPLCAGQVAARWPRGLCAAPPRGACAWGAWGGRAGAGATSPGLSTSRRRQSRCRLRAGLSWSPARGAWPVRGPGSSRWGVAGRAGKARRRPGLGPGESWASTCVAQGVARRKPRPGAPPRQRRPGHRPRRSRSPGSNRGVGVRGAPRTRARQTPATAPRRGDTPWGTRSGPGPGPAAPSRASGCCRGPPRTAAPRPEARPRGPGTSAGRWGPPGPAAPPAAAAVAAAAAAGAPSRRPYGSRGNRTRVAGGWRGSGGAGGVRAAECWYQMLRGLGFHLRNYCPTRKLKQRKSKKKIQQNQPEGDGGDTGDGRERGRGRGIPKGTEEGRGRRRGGHRTFEWKKRRKATATGQKR